MVIIMLLATYTDHCLRPIVKKHIFITTSKYLFSHRDILSIIKTFSISFYSIWYFVGIPENQMGEGEKIIWQLAGTENYLIIIQVTPKGLHALKVRYLNSEYLWIFLIFSFWFHLPKKQNISNGFISVFTAVITSVSILWKWEIDFCNWFPNMVPYLIQC